MFDDLKWHNPPADWSVDGAELRVVTGDKTDFWNHTHYGFLRADGHLFYREVQGDFQCEVTLLAGFEVLYDQLGLMVRHDDDCWLKTGLEFSDGQAQMSVVVTRDWSDWSVAPEDDAAVRAGVRIRLSRKGSTLTVRKCRPDGVWQLVRIAYLPLPETCQVGLMCCSPERKGYQAVFRDFVLGPLADG